MREVYRNSRNKRDFNRVLKNYTDLLETNDIPLHLKMPLLEYYNQKFANSKNEKRGPIITSSDDEGSEFGDESNNTTHYKFQAERGVTFWLATPWVVEALLLRSHRNVTSEGAAGVAPLCYFPPRMIVSPFMILARTTAGGMLDLAKFTEIIMKHLRIR